MDIFEQLKKEHQEVNDILEQIKNSANPDPDERKDLLLKLKLALLPHTKAEQKTLYNRLKEEEEMKDQIKEAEEEHKDVETMLVELEKMDPGSEEWMKQVGTLEENIKHHVTQEETEMFDKAKELLADPEPKEILFEYEAEKQDAIEEMGYAP